jgi:hypothetical protein
LCVSPPTERQGWGSTLGGSSPRPRPSLFSLETPRGRFPGRPDFTASWAHGRRRRTT